MSRPPEVLTFGCRLNAYESEVIRGHAEMAGWTDTVVINSGRPNARPVRRSAV